VTRTRTTVPARTRARPSNRRLTTWAATLCGLLLVQFFLGMITNLYVNIPDKHPGAGSSDFFSGAPKAIGWAITSGLPALALHVSLGLALAVISIVFIIDAARSRDRLWIWLSVAGSLLLIGAGFNGASFLVFNHDFSSLIMAGLFALSLGCYLAGIYVASRRATR